MSKHLKALIKASQRGDRQAQAEFVSLIQPDIENYIIKLLHDYNLSHLIASHLQDLVNQTWQEIFNNIDKFNGGDVLSWVNTISSMRVIDYLRREKRHHPIFTIQTKGDQFEGVHSDTPDKEVLRQEIREKLKKIPPRYSLLLKMLYWEGKSYKDIAKLFDISINSVGSLHSRALKRLSKEL